MQTSVDTSIRHPKEQNQEPITKLLVFDLLSIVFNYLFLMQPFVNVSVQRMGVHQLVVFHKSFAGRKLRLTTSKICNCD